MGLLPRFVRTQKLWPVEVNHVVGTFSNPDLGFPSDMAHVLSKYLYIKESRHIYSLCRTILQHGLNLAVAFRRHRTVRGNGLN